MNLRWGVVLTLILLLLSSSYASANTTNEGYHLVIIRSEHRLLVKKNNVVLHSYHVALGSGGLHPKLREGDDCTPSGKYHISRIRTSDRFHIFMELDYPNIHDARRALKNRLISRKQYREILSAHVFGYLPPQNTALGGSIGIHGIGVETKHRLEIHKIADWTQGCIALRNEEIDQLKQYVHIGTLVTIEK